MKFMPKGVKVNGKTVRDLQAIFARLLVVGSKRHIELSTLFNYELGPVPASIIDEYGFLRKGNKSVFVQRLGILDPNPPAPDVILVDASQLIYHVLTSQPVWDAGFISTSLKLTSSLTSTIKYLPKTTRDRGELQRPLQSIISH